MKKSMLKPGYLTTWQFEDKHSTKSHRVYYNDIDIETGDLLCDGKAVGNFRLTNHKMAEIDKKCNYMW